MSATTTAPATAPLPNIGDVIDGDRLGDDILRSVAGKDANTKKILAGGSTPKFQPRAWSYGGQID